jgi:hypothetical protein
LPSFEWVETPRPCHDMPTPEIPKFKNTASQAPPILAAKMRMQNLVAQKKSLTMVSAGQGFWRKQLLHITQHHENVTNKDQVYRHKIADLKLGQLIATELDYQQENSESDIIDQYLKLKVSFARTDHPDYPSSLEQSVKELYANIAPTKSQNTKKSKKQAKPIKKKPLVKKENDHLSVSIRTKNICFSNFWYLLGDPTWVLPFS